MGPRGAVGDAPPFDGTPDPTSAAKAATTKDCAAWGDMLVMASQAGVRAWVRVDLEHVPTFRRGWELRASYTAGRVSGPANRRR